MVALKNKLAALGAIGFLVAASACTVTSTNNTGDGGTSSSGSSGSSSGDGGSSGTSGSSGSSGSSGDGGSSSGDGGACVPQAIKFNPVACDNCVKAKCQPEIDACFKSTTATGCDCQVLAECVQGCIKTGGAGQDQCIKDCAAAHSNAAIGLENAWNQCVVDKCGPADDAGGDAGGTGDCP